MHIHRLDTGAYLNYPRSTDAMMQAKSAHSFFASCNSPDAFLQRLCESGELCELYTNDMESFMGQILEFDDDHLRMRLLHPDTLTLDEECLLVMDNIHYFWARSKSCAARSRIVDQSEASK